MIAVGLHRVGTDIQLRGNLPGTESAVNESENFQFPLAQAANAGNEIGITAVANYFAFCPVSASEIPPQSLPPLVLFRAIS